MQSHGYQMARRHRLLAIFGTGGHARDIFDVFEACRADGQPYDFEGFLLDSGYGSETDHVIGYPVLGGLDWISAHASEVHLLIGIGAPEQRFQIAKRAVQVGASFATLVHPSATTTPRISIAHGSVVMAGTRLSSNVSIGAHSHISQNCVIGHDTSLGDFVSVFPGAILSGNVRLGEGCLVGARAVVTEKLTVGAWTRIGAGSTVISSLESNVTAVGPASKVVGRRPSGWQSSDGTS